MYDPVTVAPYDPDGSPPKVNLVFVLLATYAPTPVYDAFAADTVGADRE